MGLFSGLTDLVFGKAPSSGDSMSKEDIAWLMDEGLTANRTDKQGLFGGWDWTQGEDGRWTQTENINPAMMPGIEKLMGVIGGEQAPYKSPDQFNVLLDSLMGERMQSHGRQAGGYAPSRREYKPMQRMDYSPPQKGGNTGNIAAPQEQLPGRTIPKIIDALNLWPTENG